MSRQTTPSSSSERSGSPQPSSRGIRPSASLGRTPDPAATTMSQTTPAANQPLTAAPPSAAMGLAAQTSACPLTPPLSAPQSSAFSSGLGAQASAWPHCPPYTAPPPTTSSLGLAAQASAWPHWPPHTAQPPATLGSGTSSSSRHVAALAVKHSSAPSSSQLVPPNEITIFPFYYITNACPRNLPKWLTASTGNYIIVYWKQVRGHSRQPEQDKDLNDQTDALAKAGALHGGTWTFRTPPPNPSVTAITRRQQNISIHNPTTSHIDLSPPFSSDDLLTLQTIDPILHNIASHLSDPSSHPISPSDLAASSKLRTLHSIKHMLHRSFPKDVIADRSLTNQEPHRSYAEASPSRNTRQATQSK
ncbi:hypothetical protein Q8A67_008112 [Cirrhinus molitorella]|uniref:Uncharacterized protein n=1 Tax=Cirrhinus molitorella TaxID=172907 RepID=A0AA88TRF7_9TELE|nr:hypothetical protein Q8A67_008112 [Cirrhinus molitorella]